MNNEPSRDFDRPTNEGECGNSGERDEESSDGEPTESQALDAALGAIEDFGHEWNHDPANWVRQQRVNRSQAS